MCGIAGFISHINDKKSVIKKMSDVQIHRGPDGQGFYVDKNIALCHERLAIIDLKNGKQPIYNEDKSLIIIFNGEIYNYENLKKILILDNHNFYTNTDTEVILHGYEKWGENVVKHLRGMFAFVIYNKKDNSLFLARDNYGIKPLYYYHNLDTFVFASEAKTILSYPEYNKSFNEKLLSCFLQFNFNPSSETFFKDIYKLEPGSYLTFKNGKVKIKKYFNYKITEDNLCKKNITDEIYSALRSSVSHHLISDVPVGAFLSSGVDSSFIVSLAKPQKTFTAGYKDKKYSEIDYAKNLSKMLSIENKEIIIDKNKYISSFAKIMYYMDEPIADPAIVPIYFVSSLASKYVKVVLSGEGADELFAGYNSYYEDKKTLLYKKIPFKVRKLFSLIAGFLPSKKGLNFIYRNGMPLEKYYIGIGRVFEKREVKKFLKLSNQEDVTSFTKDIFTKYRNNSTLVKKQMIDFNLWLPNDFLHAIDRCTMMFGIEARTPFLDKKVLNVASKLSLEDKIYNGKTKYALRMASKKVIPTKAYDMKKLGFPVPLNEWIKSKEIYNIIKDKFLSSSAKKYFNQDYILNLLEKHVNNKENNYKKIWTIYTFLTWYDIYF